MWANYMNILTPLVGQYPKADCDVIAVTVAALKVHKRNLQISVFAHYLIFRKVAKFFNFSGGMAKLFSRP